MDIPKFRTFAIYQPIGLIGILIAVPVAAGSADKADISARYRECGCQPWDTVDLRFFGKLVLLCLL